MKFEEILKACASGEMPYVKTSDGKIGRVATIKKNHTHAGIGVAFDSAYTYDTWYNDSDETDKRKRYIRDLEIVEVDNYGTCNNPLHSTINGEFPDCPRCAICLKKVQL